MSSRVSVVMSVYNGRRFLKQTIESVLGQTYGEFEFVIINDGSTDGSSEILDHYADKDPRVKVFGQENKGLTVSLNMGIELSSGEYIARIDVGDIASPGRLRKQVEFMDINKDIGISGTWYDLIDDGGEDIKTFKYSSKGPDIKKALLTSAPIIHSSFMIRREALSRVGDYNEEFKYAQDRELIFRIMKHYGVGLIPESLVKLRLDTGSISFDNESEQKRFCAKAIQQAINNGIYPRWCNVFAWRYIMSANFPEPVRGLKDMVARGMGVRIDRG